MSEEHPVFKVTDRRLFNADGTPREIVQEEAAQAGAKAAETEESAATVGQQAAASQESEAAESSSAREEADTAPEHQHAGHLHEEDYAETDVPGADDPASFVNFLMSIASNAAAALGMMEHPVTGQRAVDIELAKHWIDVLGMLHQKTHGNLATQEQRIFDGLLADLRMQYVTLTRAPQAKAPRGFSGRDITGGK